MKVRGLETGYMIDIMTNFKQYLEHLNFVTRSFLGVLEEIIIIGVLWETPMDDSLETPRFSIEIPRFSYKTPKFSLETPFLVGDRHNFVRDPHIFVVDPHIFFGDP